MKSGHGGLCSTSFAGSTRESGAGARMRQVPYPSPLVGNVMRGLDPRICRWLGAITEAASVGQGHSLVLTVIRRKAYSLIKGQGSRTVERAGFDDHACRSP